MGLRIYDVVIEVIRELRPLIERIRARDADLADQLQRASNSIALNLGEGAYSLKGNVRARFHDSLASAGESRTCLHIAVAAGYLEPIDPALMDKLDRVIATVYKLARK